MIVTFVCNQFELSTHEIYILFRRKQSRGLLWSEHGWQFRGEASGESREDPREILRVASRTTTRRSARRKTGFLKRRRWRGITMRIRTRCQRCQNTTVSSYKWLGSVRLGLSRRPENVPFKDETAVPGPARLKNCTPRRTWLPL